VSNSLGRYRLGAKQRIADKPSFARVLRSRLRVQAGRLALQAAKNEGEAGRLGIAIAKRYAKRSVDRNWIKRVVREAFRIHCVKYHPADFLVSLRGPLRGCIRPEERTVLRADIIALLEKAAQLVIK
jgi:ribonuclease P protein component